MNRLPGISHIAYVSAEALTPHITLQAIAKVPVGIFARLSFVPFNKRTALCETETEFDNNSTLETATLTFYSPENLPSGNLCFVVTSVNGEQYLIGTREAPFPFVKKEQTTGLSDGDANTAKYTVSYSNRVALIPISS